MKIRKIFIQFLSTLIVLSAMSGVFAQGPRGGFGHGPGGAPFWSQLTDSQKTELKALMQSLRDQKAGREAIRDAVHDKLNEWGVEMPEPPNMIDRMGDKLTEAQKNELQALIADLRSKDTSPKEIRETIHNKLNEWGIALPERHKGFGRGTHGFFGQLTDAQKDTILTLIKGLKDNGATRKEIRETIDNQLNAWGIERPQHPQGKKNKQGQKIGLQKTGKVHAWNHPNPFNPETTITYQIDDPGNVTVSIFNAQGQCVRTLESGYREAGEYRIRWDGKSDSGVTVPTGMYLYKIQAGSETFSGRMVMMK